VGQERADSGTGRGRVRDPVGTLESVTMAGFEFTLLFSANQPIASLAWQSCEPSLRLLLGDGTHLLIDTAGKMTIASDREVHAPGDAQQSEWSPCGRYLALLREGKVEIWNSRKRKLVTSPADWHRVERIAWRPRPVNSEGQLSVATACGVVTWSAEGDFDSRFPQPSSPPTALSWDPTGTRLALAAEGVQIWNGRAGEHIQFACDALHELAWDANGVVLSGASANSLFAWNVQALLHGRTEADKICDLRSPVSRMAFRPGGNILATGTIHGHVQLWRPAAAFEAVRSADLGAPVTQLAWSANGKHLAAATSSGEAYAVRVCR
jgi:WD40 repeat protein